MNEKNLTLAFTTDRTPEAGTLALAVLRQSPQARQLTPTKLRADALAWLAKRGHPLLVIHGVWAYGALQVWAEDSALPAHAPPRQGRPSRAPRPHPFAVPAGELADALAAAGSGGSGPQGGR